MNTAPFDMVAIENLDQIMHGGVSKGYYLITFIANS